MLMSHRLMLQPLARSSLIVAESGHSVILRTLEALLEDLGSVQTDGGAGGREHRFLLRVLLVMMVSRWFL